MKAATVCRIAVLLPDATSAVVMFSMLGEQSLRKLQLQRQF